MTQDQLIENIARIIYETERGNRICRKTDCKECRYYPVDGDICPSCHTAEAILDAIAKDPEQTDEYTLLGVMHSVDKWLEGEELEQDPVKRAIAMREKTLCIVENLQNEVECLRAYKEYFQGLYGTGLTVMGWHQNGEPIDFDDFCYSAEAEYATKFNELYNNKKEKQK